jgi:hypothetical protein
LAGVADEHADSPCRPSRPDYLALHPLVVMDAMLLLDRVAGAGRLGESKGAAVLVPGFYPPRGRQSRASRGAAWTSLTADLF